MVSVFNFKLLFLDALSQKPRFIVSPPILGPEVSPHYPSPLTPTSDSVVTLDFVTRPPLRVTALQPLGLPLLSPPLRASAFRFGLHLTVR